VEGRLMPTIPELLLRIGVWAVEYLHWDIGCHLYNLGRVCITVQR